MATHARNHDELVATSGRSEPDQASQSTELRDGGYGWVVVFACFVQTFWVNAWTGSWGIIQVALLLQGSMHTVPASTLSFVGPLGLSLTVALALACVWLAGVIGSRRSGLIGITLFGASTLVGSFTVSNITGLFMSAALYGMGGSLMFTMFNNLPLQWLRDRLGTANGLVKLGGGIGATVMAFAVQQLIDKLGIAWTFRIMALSSVMACYNACMALGHLSSGIACDKLGSTNMLLLTMALNAVTMLAIWSVASTLAVLIIFAALNGIANGAFFVTMPTAIGKLLGPHGAPVGIVWPSQAGASVTFWVIPLPACHGPQ
ncbi:hypothetical protein BDV26DRAFT_292198 [Aspergillus bertholletiae]|uniref:Major facilitator superfamily domain-containing protein n=1 Tax=Aspergillus bertholletiae TaxID=1226010 RepID=A0A5N7B9W2_9EURO|nr:hypothetical protein BDV26DRAFT_292198 [Aspergillus bertholletiae]